MVVGGGGRKIPIRIPRTGMKIIFTYGLLCAHSKHFTYFQPCEVGLLFLFQYYQDREVKKFVHRHMVGRVVA